MRGKVTPEHRRKLNRQPPRDLAEVTREQLAAQRITASQEAIQYLVAHLGNDRMVTRQELAKLALYAGYGGRVELADAMASVAVRPSNLESPRRKTTPCTRP